MNTPKYLKDIDETAAGRPFGVVKVEILRHRSKTARVTFLSESRLKPITNEQAFSDLETLINNLISTSFTGKVAFDLSFKDGTIDMITIKNKEVKQYGVDQRE